MSARDTVLVLGGGINGLAAAAFLAKAGRRVVLLEQRSDLGGTAASAEFHPGYRSAGLWHDVSRVRPWVVDALGLEDHGLRQHAFGADVLVAGHEGQSLLLRSQLGAACEEIARHSHKDAEAYRALHGFLDTVKPVVAGFLDGSPVDFLHPEAEPKLDLLRRGWDLRRLGGETLMELLRLPPMSVADWMHELFETELLRTGLAFGALPGAFMGPRSPQSNANLLLDLCARDRAVKGGGPALATALAQCARAAGAELRIDSQVTAIRTEARAVTGVTLANGESLDATVVLSTLDPKTTFLRLMDPGLLPARLTEHIGAWRTRGIVAHLLLALNQPLRFAARPTERVAHALVAGSLNELEQAFDAVKYGRSSETPVLDVCVPTVEDASLAPAGHEVVSVLVYFAPHDPEGGWTPQSRDALAARALDRLEAAAPGVKGSLVAQVLRTPAGLEAEFGLSGGHLHHGEHALDQILVRPAPDCVKYGTPVGGLYLGGGGSHPGGGPTGAPGVMAAKALLGR